MQYCKSWMFSFYGFASARKRNLFLRLMRYMLKPRMFVASQVSDDRFEGLCFINPISHAESETHTMADVERALELFKMSIGVCELDSYMGNEMISCFERIQKGNLWYGNITNVRNNILRTSGDGSKNGSRRRWRRGCGRRQPVVAEYVKLAPGDAEPDDRHGDCATPDRGFSQRGRDDDGGRGDTAPDAVHVRHADPDGESREWECNGQLRQPDTADDPARVSQLPGLDGAGPDEHARATDACVDPKL